MVSVGNHTDMSTPVPYCNSVTTSFPLFPSVFLLLESSRFQSALVVSLLGGGQSRTEVWKWTTASLTDAHAYDHLPRTAEVLNCRFEHAPSPQLRAELRRRPLDKGCAFGVGRQRLGSTALIYDGWDRRKGHALINMRVFDWGGHQLCPRLLTVDLADEMDLPDIRKLSLRKLGCINHSEWSHPTPVSSSNWRMDVIHTRTGLLFWCSGHTGLNRMAQFQKN